MYMRVGVSGQGRFHRDQHISTVFILEWAFAKQTRHGCVLKGWVVVRTGQGKRCTKAGRMIRTDART